MKRPRKLLCFAAALLMALLLTVVPASADTGESTLQISGEPAKLIIQLGPGWAGTQFELRTDAGMYPGTVVVSDTGLLQMDLGGSKTFTLSRVQGTGSPPAAQVTTATPAADTPTVGGTAPAIAATTDPDVDLDAFLAALTEPGTEVPEEQPAQQEEPAPESVPIKHILIFGGGIVAAVIALIVLASLKKRRVADDEDDDYED